MTDPGGAGAEPAGIRWFDSHCHLQEEYLARDEGGGPDGGPDPHEGADDSARRALEACRSAGVGRLVCVGTDPATSAQALDMARHLSGPAGPEVWATIGLHPHEASVPGVTQVAAMLDAATEAAGDRGGRVLVAVGECGLDYHYDHAPREAQRRAFAEQVQLAHHHALALVIHAREAWDDLFDILDAEGVPERTVVHCFTGGPHEARRCLDAGMRISFSGIITFNNAAEVREAAALCPLDLLLVETDSPFLAPVPHRGRPNQPAFVPRVGEAVAAAKGLAPGEVARSSWDSASSLFAV